MKNAPVFLFITEHVRHIKKQRAALREPHVPPLFELSAEPILSSPLSDCLKIDTRCR